MYKIYNITHCEIELLLFKIKIVMPYYSATFAYVKYKIIIIKKRTIKRKERGFG